MGTLLSIITLFNYDPTIFDDMLLPDELDKDLVTDTIMLELGELELLYNDPNMMKFAIGRWSSKELKKWEELYSTTVLEYNPIENYNRTEDFTDTETRDLATNGTETRNLATNNIETRNLAANNTETRNLTGANNETRDLTTGVAGDTDTVDVDVQSGSNAMLKETSAYNSAVLITNALDTETLGSTNTKTVGTHTEQTGTDSGTVNVATTDVGTVDNDVTDTGTVDNETADTGTVDNDATDTGTVELKKVGNAKGNIGVTTTQQMIEQERGVVEFNIYDYITESFKKRFCILVY